MERNRLDSRNRERGGSLRPRTAARLARAGRRFLRDRRGGTAVQAMVLMPAILFAFVAGIKLWETMMIRRSLHTGTYLAARYLSLYPLDDISQYEWESVASRFVYAELKNNPFVNRQELNESRTPVTVTLLDGSNQCTDKFEITVEYPLLVPKSNPGVLQLPNLEWLHLREVRQGEVVCD